MRKLIYTRVALSTDEDGSESEIRKLQGKDSEVDVWGKVTFLLDEVVGVMEHYPAAEDEPAPDQCNVTLKNGKTWGVAMPYEELKDLLRQFHGESNAPAIDVSQAVATLARALDEDKDLYLGYQNNIAVAFMREYEKSFDAVTRSAELKRIINNIASQAAKNFLDQLIQSIK